MKNKNQPLTERDKQTKPMPGETDPRDAFMKARLFASLAKSKLGSNGAKLK